MRKKELVLEVIAETLESIVEENEIILSYQHTIPQIELDMILGNIRKLYENYRLLDKYNLEETEKIQHEAAMAMRTPEPEVQAQEEESASEEEKEEDLVPGSPPEIPVNDNRIRIGFSPRKVILPEPEPEVEAAEDTVPENTTGLLSEQVPESEQETLPEPEPVLETVPEQEVIPVPTADILEEEQETSEMPADSSKQDKKIEITLDLFSDQPLTVADKYRKEETTLHEKITPVTQEESIASKLERSQIPDLKSTIGLNDKFIFINELFHGNMKAYQEAISTLDQFVRLNDAIRYFNEITEAFDMQEDQPSYKRFAEMIRRKYQ